jgi:biotin carboxyl carrier protein
MPTFKVEIGGKESVIQVERQGDRLQITHGGETTSVRLVQDDGTSFLFEQELADGSRRRVQAAGHVSGNERQLWVEGRIYSYRRVRGGATLPVEDFANSLSASIPALVSELLVQIGDKVATGEKLILLESMKMVIPIQAPCNGTVTAINCAAGDAVQPGTQLVEIEETNE